MDLLIAEERRTEVVPVVRHWPAVISLVAYGLIVAATIAHHEPWADEAQSWLLARDAGLSDLWVRLLHYEGTTGLWQTLLHVLIAAGLPYSAMNVVSGLLGLSASALLVLRAPFPLPIRAALPFAYFLCYQYAVIARSYDLLPVLMFACAILFPRAAGRPGLFTLLLCLMAAVSVHGMLLAASIGLAAWIDCGDRKRVWPYAGAFLLAAAALTFAAWPAPDGTFVPRFNFSFEHFIAVSGNAFTAAFTGETVTSLAVIGLSLPLLWRGRGLLFFGLASGLLCAVYAVVYAQVWHFGLLFLAWIFALWISYARNHRPITGRLAMAAVAVVIAVQCYWTSRAVTYDWKYPYSGAPAAARAVASLGLANHRIYAIGYACVAIQPYFSHNIFSNWNNGQAPGYWDWSNRNHVNQDSLLLSKLRPDYVMVGYKNGFEKGVWTDLVKKGGYQEIRHFEGNSFWQWRVFEPESFDLYRLDRGK